MATGRFRGNQLQELDIRQIIQEAHIRWLRPLEVCEILRHYQRYNFRLNPVPPNKPGSGSLFLFDRKALRYFRKDGHSWRKKKDGKTVREAHERLKAGSIDVLHCYYAHGEDNPNFQRRSYWMLEGAYEHIVLVHYLEVPQSNRAGSYRSYTEQAAVQNTSYNNNNQSVEFLSASPDNGTIDATQGSSSISSEIDEADSNDDAEEIQVPEPLRNQPSLLQQLSLPRDWSNISFPTSPQQQQSYDTPTSSQSPMLDDIDLGDLLKNPDMYLGPKPLSPAISLDLSGWNDLLAGCQQPNGMITSKGGGIIKQENSSPWQEMLEQCTTPATRSALLSAVNSRNSDDGFLSKASSSSTSPKPILQVLSPKGLGREPQTVLEAHLRAATEENALKAAAAAEANRRWQEPNATSAANVHIDIDRATQQMGTQQSSQQSWEFISQNGHSNSSLPFQYWSTVQQQQFQQPQQQQQQQQHVKFFPKQEEEDASMLPVNLNSAAENEVGEGLKKLDSFGRWVIQEMGDDSPSALLGVTSESSSYWMSSLEDQNTPTEETSGLSTQMQLDMNLSISQVQRFSINDFSPDWAFSDGATTKVLISGRFLEAVKKPEEYKWCCMFGDVEVAADVINVGVLRCEAPSHSPGRIPFYVTCCDRVACSEVREFEYRRKEGKGSISGNERGIEASTQLELQLRLARMLLKEREKGKGKGLRKRKENGSGNVDVVNVVDVVDGDVVDVDVVDVERGKEEVVECLLKYMVHDWISVGEGVSVVDSGGQGVLHMVAALGYDWAIKPILESGTVVADFRDSRGWTALHWAASMGREKTVLELLACGASPGPLTDPTQQHLTGQTPADVAAGSGHKGIAGYLAEMALTAHLSSMSIADNYDKVNELSSMSAALAGDSAAHEFAEVRNNIEGGGEDERLSLRRSLSAVRNATKAAALIHSAFRQDSFRKRSSSGGVIVEEEYALAYSHKMQMQHAHREQSAALHIQRKFRGWKGRRDFLKLRKHVVRIQAHVRGHQVRKKFRKILWVVGVIEKAVLRWRRKRVGLRGFKREEEKGVSSDDDDFLKEGRKEKEMVLEKAVCRVQSMARSVQARAQYRRMLEGGKMRSNGDEEEEEEGDNNNDDNDDAMSNV